MRCCALHFAAEGPLIGQQASLGLTAWQTDEAEGPLSGQQASQGLTVWQTDGVSSCVRKFTADTIAHLFTHPLTHLVHHRLPLTVSVWRGWNVQRIGQHDTFEIESQATAR